MPTSDEFWKVAAQVASERGGLVVGFAKDSEQPELGSALDNVLGFSPQAPVTVISLSDWTDWKEQVEVFYRLRPAWGRGKGGVPDANYYRVKFDEFGTPMGSISTTIGKRVRHSPAVTSHLLADMLRHSAAFKVFRSGLGSSLASSTSWFITSSHS